MSLSKVSVFHSVLQCGHLETTINLKFPVWSHNTPWKLVLTEHNATIRSLETETDSDGDCFQLMKSEIAEVQLEVTASDRKN